MVTDQNGAPVVQVSGPAFWINHFKSEPFERHSSLTTAISDPSGTPLFKMRNKKASLLRRFICEDERGTELFRVQRKWAACRSPPHFSTLAPGTNASPGQAPRDHP